MSVEVLKANRSMSDKGERASELWVTPAGLTLAEIGSLASRPFVGMEEEPSELERLCLEVRAQLEALSDDDDDGDASSTDTDEECIMAADHYHQDASHESGAETVLGGAAANDGQEYASSSRMSSGTLYNTSGSYEMSFLGGARPSGNIMHEVSRCGCRLSTP